MENEKTTVEETRSDGSAGSAAPVRDEDFLRLKKAYEALLKEFTRRSQRIKELEKRNGELIEQFDSREKELAAQSAALMQEHARDMLRDAAFVESYVLCDEGIKARIIDSYLLSLKKAAVPGVLRTGVGSAVLTPPSLPKSLDEARRLASMILKA